MEALEGSDKRPTRKGWNRSVNMYPALTKERTLETRDHCLRGIDASTVRVPLLWLWLQHNTDMTNDDVVE